MLEMKNVSMQYPKGKLVLDNINCLIKNGELVFLTGRSGAGKSTFLKILPMIIKHSQGEVICNGFNLNKISSRQIPFLRRKIGIISQTPLFLQDRDVFNNVAFPLIINGEPYRNIHNKVRAALDKVGLLGKERFMPNVLSGGEQQRIGIARAIVNKPPLLLADEPTGNLDPNLAKEIMTLFLHLNQVGVTTIIATHNLELINNLAFRKLILQNGRLLIKELCYAE